MIRREVITRAPSKALSVIALTFPLLALLVVTFFVGARFGLSEGERIWRKPVDKVENNAPYSIAQGLDGHVFYVSGINTLSTIDTHTFYVNGNLGE